MGQYLILGWMVSQIRHSHCDRSVQLVSVLLVLNSEQNRNDCLKNCPCCSLGYLIVFRRCVWSAWDAPECGEERGLQTETGDAAAEGEAGEAEIPAERPHLLSQTQQLLRPDIPGVRGQVHRNGPARRKVSGSHNPWISVIVLPVLN